MRALLRSWLVAAFVAPTVSLFACSPSPGEPTLPAGADGKPVSRDYPYECALEAGTTSGTGTFQAIYTEIISDQTGVAKCQNGACHGAGAANGDFALGNTKKDAFCGMASFVLIQPHDCTSCDFCADEIKMAKEGACGDDAGINHACCVPCSAGSDAGTDAESDAATDSGMSPPTPVEVAGLHDIVSPDRKGKPPKMPKIFCGNRLLGETEVNAIDAWGRKGAPLE
jgi:hypothetical protein